MAVEPALEALVDIFRRYNFDEHDTTPGESAGIVHEALRQRGFRIVPETTSDDHWLIRIPKSGKSNGG